MFTLINKCYASFCDFVSPVPVNQQDFQTALEDICKHLQDGAVGRKPRMGTKLVESAFEVMVEILTQDGGLKDCSVPLEWADLAVFVAGNNAGYVWTVFMTKAAAELSTLEEMGELESEDVTMGNITHLMVQQ